MLTRTFHPFVATFARTWDVVWGYDHVLANVATTVCHANARRREIFRLNGRLHYEPIISRRLVGRDGARQTVRDCLDNLTVLSVDRHVLEQAYVREGVDFEDAVQIAAAEQNGLDAIVTRDTNDFSSSPIGVVSPAELASRLPESES